MQGVKARGAAVLGGELQNIDNVSLLVSFDIAGDDDALAVSQTLACRFSPLSSEPASYRYSSVTLLPVVLYTVYSAEVASASEETTSEEAASEEAAAEDAVEDAAVEAAPPQAVMPTASARAAAAIATVLSFIGIISFFSSFCWCQLPAAYQLPWLD